MPAPTENNFSKDNNNNDHPSELAQYEAFMRAQLPKRVRRELEKRIEQQMAPIEEHIKAQLVDIVRDLQLKLLEEFRKPNSPGTTTNRSTLDTDVTANSSFTPPLKMVYSSLESSPNLNQNEPVMGKLPESWKVPHAQISSTTLSTQYSQEPVVKEPSDGEPSKNPIPEYSCYANDIEHEMLVNWHDACRPSQSATHDSSNIGRYAPYYNPASSEGSTLPFDQHEGPRTESWVDFDSGNSGLSNWDGFPSMNATYPETESQSAPSLMTMSTCSTLTSSLASRSASVSTSSNGFVFDKNQQGESGDNGMDNGVVIGLSWPYGLENGSEDSSWDDWAIKESLW